MGWLMKDFHVVENFIPVVRTLQGALAPRLPLRYFAGPENYAFGIHRASLLIHRQPVGTHRCLRIRTRIQ